MNWRGRGSFLHRGCRHHRVGFETVEERRLHGQFLGLQGSEHPVEVAELDKQALEMADAVPSQPADVGDLPAQFPAPAVDADQLAFAEHHRVVVVEGRVFLIEQAHTAGTDRPNPDLEVVEE